MLQTAATLHLSFDGTKMECSVCHNNHRKLYCVNCLREGLRNEVTKIKSVNAEKQKYVERATALLNDRTRELQRLLAEKHTRAETAEVVAAETAVLREEIVKDRQTVAALRTHVTLRRQRLQEAQARFATAQEQVPTDISRAVGLTRDKWQHVHQIHTHSKRVLVSELVSLFDLKRVEPPPPPVAQSTLTALAQGHRRRSGISVPAGSGGGRGGGDGVATARTEGEEDEYEICGVRMKGGNKGEILKKDQEEFNAAVGHVVHLLSLLIQYLGVKLPYVIVNRGVYSYAKKMLPNRQTSSKQPLHLTDQNVQAFTVGLAMLNYDIAYLCYTQGLDVPPLNRVSNTLQNLLACCQSPKLGRYSHNTTYALLHDQPFSLEFEQVLRLTPKFTATLVSVHEATLHDNYFYEDGFGRRFGPDDDDAGLRDRAIGGEQDDEGGETWDLVDVVLAPGAGAVSAASLMGQAVVSMVMGTRTGEETRGYEGGYSVAGAAGGVIGGVGSAVGSVGTAVGGVGSAVGSAVGGVGSAVGSGLVALGRDLWARGVGQGD